MSAAHRDGDAAPPPAPRWSGPDAPESHAVAAGVVEALLAALALLPDAALGPFSDRLRVRLETLRGAAALALVTVRTELAAAPERDTWPAGEDEDELAELQAMGLVDDERAERQIEAAKEPRP